MYNFCNAGDLIISDRYGYLLLGVVEEVDEIGFKKVIPLASNEPLVMKRKYLWICLGDKFRVVEKNSYNFHIKEKKYAEVEYDFMGGIT